MLTKELQALGVVALALLASALPPRQSNHPHSDGKIYAPAFGAVRGQPLRQPKKPVYHYTPIKPFTLEDLGNTYRGKVVSKSRTGYELSRPIIGPQVHEPSTELPPLSRPIIPPTPIRINQEEKPSVLLRPTRPSVQMKRLYGSPEADDIDIKNIRLGEAFVGDQPSSGVVQKLNPSQGKYHFEYRVRNHDGEFGHAEARDGPLTSGGYDVNLRKTHVQSVRYLVDSKEIPRYGYAHL